MPSALLWFRNTALFIWGILAFLAPCLVMFIMAPAHGRLFQQYEFIAILGGYLRFAVYVSGGLLVVFCVICSTRHCLKHSDIVTPKPIQPKQFIISIIAIFALSFFAPYIWERAYIPLIGEYAYGSEMTVYGTVVALNEARGRPSAKPALDMTFVLDGDGTRYIAHFDSFLRTKPWYELDDFRQWRPQVGDRAKFSVKENAFGRTVVRIQGNTNLTGASDAP